jgi:hypothetical protein
MTAIPQNEAISVAAHGIIDFGIFYCFPAGPEKIQQI